MPQRRSRVTCRTFQRQLQPDDATRQDLKNKRFYAPPGDPDFSAGAEYRVSILAKDQPMPVRPEKITINANSTKATSSRAQHGSALHGMLATRFRVIVDSKIFFRER